jgi:hypothetical protein
VTASSTTVANCSAAPPRWRTAARLPTATPRWQTLDSNGDGQITAADNSFGALRVWVDGNSDGVSQADELKTLDQLGIASIATHADNALTLQNGNAIGLTSSYTGTDGSTHASADVWFLAQKGATTVAPSLQQQVSGLSNAISSFAASRPSPPQPRRRS